MNKKKITLIVSITLCFLAIGIYSYLSTRYTVTIINRSESSVSNIQISGGGYETRIDEVKADSSTTKTLNFTADGQLEFRSSLNKEPYIIDGYVTGNLKGNTKVIIDKDGKITYENSP